MFKLSIVLFLSAAICAYAAVGIYPYEAKPAEFADREGCFSSSLKIVLPYNESYYPKDDCVEYKCIQSTNQIQLLSCGAMDVPRGSHLVSDFTFNYPDCCPKLKSD